MIKLWDAELQKEVNTLKGHCKYITSVAFSANSKYLASGSYDKSVKLWSLETQKIEANLQEHINLFKSMALSSDSNYLACVS
jgi:WD40 repeat protein